MSRDLLLTMIPFMGCIIRKTQDGVELTGASEDHMMAVALTPTGFRPPFTVRAVAKTDSTNLRLYWHVGEVIFNWEVSVRRLKVHDPETGQWWDAANQGFLPRTSGTRSRGKFYQRRCVFWSMENCDLSAVAAGEKSKRR